MSKYSTATDALASRGAGPGPVIHHRGAVVTAARLSALFHQHISRNGDNREAGEGAEIQGLRDGIGALWHWRCAELIL